MKKELFIDRGIGVACNVYSAKNAKPRAQAGGTRYVRDSETGLVHRVKESAAKQKLK